MKNILTFIIPVRHQNNARNWPELKANLAETMKSISAQDATGWKAIIVANFGADLPELRSGFEVKWVDYPPNELHDQGESARDQFLDAFRIDKGKRVLAGMLHAGQMGHVMIVDDDDLVIRRLTSYVTNNQNANGWYFEQGLIWGHKTAILFLSTRFSSICGTSHIVKAELYDLPATLDQGDASYVRSLLGSHIYLRRHLEATGRTLQPLPFPGAVYRVGHLDAHSKSGSILRSYIFGGTY